MTESGAPGLEKCLVIEFAPSSILPPVCPLCGKIGIIPVPIQAEKPEVSVTAHYCELCHQQERSQDTFLFSLSMALAVVCAAAVGVALSVLREQWTEWIPLALAVGGGTTAAGFAILSRRTRQRPALGRGSRGHQLLILPEGPGARALLAELGALRSEEQAKRFEARHRGTLWLALAPLAGMILPVVVTYLRLRARVVVVDPHDDDVLLVDSTLVGKLPSVRHEWPSGGLTVQLIAGSRRLEIAAADGATRLEERAFLEPGGAYVFGHLPEGLCLYREEQHYGTSSGRLLFEIPGGPLYPLQSDIQYFFEAPPEPETAGSRGGVAVAVRLLPCPHPRASSDPPR